MAGSASPQKLSNPYFLLVLLLLAYILSFIDRNIMAILVGPIREDFNISDKYYAWLNGPAFTFLYVILGMPIAWLADRKSRKNIIAQGTAFWSVMTFLCGLATGFSSFFMARMGVGVGEAALSPPAHSLLADYFDKRKLPVVMAIFTLGIPVGVGISYSLGGWVYGVFAEQGGLVLPLLGSLKPWQLTFMLVGLPGLIVAALIYQVVEPARSGLLKVENKASDDITVVQTLVFLRRHLRVYLSVFLAVSALSVLGYSFMMWFVAHASRVYATPEYAIGKTFGLLYLGCGVLGTVFGAALSGYMSRRGYQDAGIRVILIIAALWLLPSIVVTQVPTLQMAYWVSAPCIFCLNAYFGLSIAAIQVVTPNQMRAQVSSVFLFFTNISGLLVGPVIVGYLSSDWFSGKQALGHALSCVACVCCPLAIVLILQALKPYRLLLLQAENNWL